MAIVKFWFQRVMFPMKIKHFAAVLFMAAAPLLAWSADAPDQLRKLIADVPAAAGQFSQQRLDSQGQGKAQSGELSFRRLGQIRWSVKKPYVQLIVSNGHTVYYYDPVLDQVTARHVDLYIGALSG